MEGYVVGEMTVSRRRPLEYKGIRAIRSRSLLPAAVGTVSLVVVDPDTGGSPIVLAPILPSGPDLSEM